MAKNLYKVLVIGLLLKNNSMAEAGQEIEGDKFASPIDELVKGGYVKKVKSKKSDKPKDQEMMDVVISQKHLDDNPDLIEKGIKVGDTVQIPKQEDKSKGTEEELNPENNGIGSKEEPEDIELKEGESKFDYMLKAELIQYAEENSIDISQHKTADEIREYLKDLEGNAG